MPMHSGNPYHPQSMEWAQHEAMRQESAVMAVTVELPELNAALAAGRVKDAALEAKACALMRQYGLLLPGPAKAFFRELADHLSWTNLKAILK